MHRGCENVVWRAIWMEIPDLAGKAASKLQGTLNPDRVRKQAPSAGQVLGRNLGPDPEAPRIPGERSSPSEL